MFQLTPVSLPGPLGAELTGFDIPLSFSADLPADSARCAVLSVLHAHRLLIIRTGTLSPAAQVALASVLGSVSPYPPALRHLSHPDYPEIGLVGEARSLGAQYWHTDGLAQPETPSATLLYARQVPAHGGDTMFVDACAAYERLPERLRERIEGRRMVYDDGVTHPMVRIHPVTGQRALFLELMPYRSRIEGLGAKEKEALIRELIVHVEQPEFIYRHCWREGDLLVWDNAAVLHRAAEAVSSGPRLLHRVTVCTPAPE